MTTNDPNQPATEPRQPLLPRRLPDVIDQVLALIPESESVLRYGLACIKSSACYAPPENWGQDWRLGSLILKRHLGEPPLPSGSWQERVRRTWVGETMEAVAESETEA